MSFATAIKTDMDHRARSNSLNRELVGTLPKDPERGSYYWWAHICRQNTGQSICDSGIAYGYGYNATVMPEGADPIVVEFHDGNLDTVSVSTIKFLESTTEAEDETAKAIEDVLLWCGTWLHPRESWGTCIREFPKDLEKLKEAIYRYGEYGIRVRVKGHGASVRRVLQDAISCFGFHDFPRAYTNWSTAEIQDSQFISDALKDFPRKALAVMWDCGALDLDIGRGDNIYNHENDLDQVFQYTLIGDGKDVYDEQFAIIQVHTGADVRGGYANPVVAAIDVDSFFTWQVGMWCNGCDESYYGTYDYTSKWEGDNAANVPDIEVDTLLSRQAALDQIESGQLALLDVVSEPLADIEKRTLDYAIRIRIEEKDLELVVQYPQGSIEDDDDKKFPERDGFDRYPASSVVLLCPKCGKYGARVGMTVEGMM